MKACFGRIAIFILLPVILITALLAGCTEQEAGFSDISIISEGNGESEMDISIESSEESIAVNPLEGKRFIFLGSSVTYGNNGYSFVEVLAERNGCIVKKEAVSGTTLTDKASSSYVQRMLNNINTNNSFDHFICQLSTNDASQNLPLGVVSDSKNIEDFDTSTIIGSMEYIIAYASATWNCPVSFYTGTYYSSAAYQKMVDALYELREKWHIGIIDLWNNAEMRGVSSQDYSKYMNDPVHPSKLGYEEWWTPVFEQFFIDFYSEQ